MKFYLKTKQDLFRFIMPLATKLQLFTFSTGFSVVLVNRIIDVWNFNSISETLVSQNRGAKNAKGAITFNDHALNFIRLLL